MKNLNHYKAIKGLLVAGTLLTAACSSGSEDGAEGATGETGSPGTNGSDGQEGQRGASGEPGAVGTSGQDYSPPQLVLAGERAFPEGIASDDDGALYVGSFFDGTVWRAEAGSLSTEAFSSGVLQNATGLLVYGDYLLACDNYMTTGFDQESALVVLSLKDGTELARHSMKSGPSICNDITLDEEGNLYATESFGNAIYSVSADQIANDSSMTLWSSDALFSANYEAGNFGLNGIAHAVGEGLYVVNFFTGELFLVPMLKSGGAGPAEIVELTTATGETRPLAAPDGLKVTGDGWLMVTEQGQGWLARIDTKTKTIFPTAGGFDKPSTFALDAEGTAWVVNSQLDDFAMGTAPTLPFVVVSAPLD